MSIFQPARCYRGGHCGQLDTWLITSPAARSPSRPVAAAAAAILKMLIFIMVMRYHDDNIVQTGVNGLKKEPNDPLPDITQPPAVLFFTVR